MKDDPNSQQRIEFEHLVRILGGKGITTLNDHNRLGRASKGLFEWHIGHDYDRPGCFAYVGWAGKVTAELQETVQNAFAEASVASGVFLGALEPHEGFGLVTWREKSASLADSFDESYRAMRQTIAHAAHLLNQAKLGAALNTTHVAVGCGRIRGHVVFGEQPVDANPVIDGPRIVAAIYGEIPNLCGGIAKWKLPAARALFKADGGGMGVYTLYREPWTYFHLTAKAPSRDRVWAGQTQIPHELLHREPLAPEGKTGHLQLYLVGLSLDFSRSSDEYRSNPHGARTVTNTLLAEFENIATEEKCWFVSPRYGDGLAAVVVVLASSDGEAIVQGWKQHLVAFAAKANQQLEHCAHLGLRIGLAAAPDNKGCAVRLAGVNRLASAAVEPLAKFVIDRAREVHQPVKESKDNPTRAVGCFRMRKSSSVDFDRIPLV